MDGVTLALCILLTLAQRNVAVFVQRQTNEQNNVAATIFAGVAPTVGTWLADCRSASRGAIATLMDCLGLYVFTLCER